MKFNKLIPELSVSDLEASKRFYVDVLGFKIEYERKEDKFTFLSRGEIQIMLEEINGHWSVGPLERPFGRGINFQLEVDDIDAVAKALGLAGVKPFKDLFESKYRNGDEIYHEKELLVQDPDGYLIRFQQDLIVVE